MSYASVWLVVSKLTIDITSLLLPIDVLGDFYSQIEEKEDIVILDI